MRGRKTYGDKANRGCEIILFLNFHVPDILKMIQENVSIVTPLDKPN